ncbi:hypothetical protein JTB14_027878 [Gonioctena quinquepunctata]|nr:hypothetical protein JTB14_027878 [Gonioctena quinquepunctata]
MANSPRPGTWILERSIDGESFEPWQFFARSDMECLERFGIPATKGKPQYFTDFEVICTSFYSRLTPLENGEHPECECGHHTCGPNCDKCCPMFNQRQWGSGSARDARQCLPCNCHGHATSCHYDDDVDRSGLSLDVHGNYQGGGVCDNCTDNTTGINCDKCQPGFFRPPGVLPDVPKPCFRCECDVTGSTASCVQYGPDAGTCLCRDGFTGDRCDACASGHRGFPACELCPCDAKGVAGLGDCEGECVCKANVEGKYCDRCKSGHFGLRNDIPEGCLSCFCSGVTTLCESAIVIPQKVGSLKEWQITDLKVSRAVRPNWNGQSVFSLGNYDFPGIKSLYWLAPEDYLGNKLEAYNSNFIFTVQWVVMRGDTSGETTRGPNIVFVGNNGLKIAYGDDSQLRPKQRSR